MVARRWVERIHDIINAIAEIGAFTAGMTREQFAQDKRTIKAVELNFIIIGEAAGQVPEEIQQSHPEVPWKVMKAMRNRLVHVYFDADLQIVWETVVADLPPLVEPLTRLIAAAESDLTAASRGYDADPSCS